MCLGVSDPKTANRPVRQELAEQQHILGYSLVDFWGIHKDEVEVVSFADRTFTTAKITKNRALLERTSAPCVFREDVPETGQTDMENRYPLRCFSADQRQVALYSGKQRARGAHDQAADFFRGGGGQVHGHAVHSQGRVAQHAPDDDAVGLNIGTPGQSSNGDLSTHADGAADIGPMNGGESNRFPDAD